SVFGSESFEGVTFTGINSIILAEGVNAQQTITANASTVFGSTGILNFNSGSTGDIFDYESDLKSGSGNTSQNQAIDTLALSTPGASVTAISGNASAVIEFSNAQLSVGLDLTNSTAANIVSDVQSLLESTSSNQITQSNTAVTQGAANTDSLLIFFENSSGFGTTRDAVVMRYQEGANPDSLFDNELSVFAVFTSVDDFDAANIS
ncbi:uncharacterized protein METZ01_LOCUS410328, partial [marine metagenome]